MIPDWVEAMEAEFAKLKADHEKLKAECATIRKELEDRQDPKSIRCIICNGTGRVKPDTFPLR